MDFYQTIHRLFRCCLHCGSTSCGDSQFCLKCENDLWRAHSQLQSFELNRGHAQGRALFDWYPNEDRKVSKLMMSLKGGRLTQCLDFYAQSFISRNHQQPSMTDSVLIPCPASGTRVHAQVLSRSFSKRLAIPVLDCLHKEASSMSQKSKNKAERERVLMTCSEDLGQKHVIFIDDVVTTGATVLSARNAIGPCQSFEVWCLAHRRQLAAYTSL